MNEQQNHEMILDKTHPSGADEWYCPNCGRRLLIVYAPTFRKTVLEAGDEFAMHSGGKGGVSMRASRIVPSEELETEKDHRLSAWSDWLDKMNFDAWWEE